MIEWRKYQDIENSYRKKVIDDIYEQGLNGGLWVVQEKIDGANGSFVTDGNRIRMAKRTCLIDDDAEFNGLKQFRDENKDTILEVYNMCNSFFGGNLTSVVVYGECFGGYYPHPDVTNDNKVKVIQGRVYYSPKHEFMAYDILCVRKDESFFLDYTDFWTIMSELDFPRIPALIVASFEECLKYPNTFQTIIPEILGYPPIENNIAEGVVIKPYEHKRFRNRSRVILKNKNDKFAEKKKSKKKVSEELSEAGNAVYNSILEYVTENRLKNVVSKFDTIIDKDFGKLLGAFMQDVMKDYSKENERVDLDKKEEKLVNKMVNKEAAAVIRKHFLNIIDGTF